MIANTCVVTLDVLLAALSRQSIRLVNENSGLMKEPGKGPLARLK